MDIAFRAMVLGFLGVLGILLLGELFVPQLRSGGDPGRPAEKSEVIKGAGDKGKELDTEAREDRDNPGDVIDTKVGSGGEEIK
jgi:hypothetical protein